MEDEALKAHWRTGDGGQSFEGALEDWRRRTKPGLRNGGQKTKDEASFEDALEDRR